MSTIQLRVHVLRNRIGLFFPRLQVSPDSDHSSVLKAIGNSAIERMLRQLDRQSRPAGADRPGDAARVQAQ